MCSIEEKLERVNKLPPFLRRYVDDAFALVRDSSAAASFLTTRNEAQPSINFTMETAANGRYPLLELKSPRRITIWNRAFTERRLTKGYSYITRATSISGINDHSR